MIIFSALQNRQLESELAEANARDNGNAIALLHGLGFSQEQLMQPVSYFSGGWRRGTDAPL